MALPPLAEPLMFQPSWDEFQDSAAYLGKIMPMVESKGICIIRPPPQWCPTCNIDFDSNELQFDAQEQHFSDLKIKSETDSDFAARQFSLNSFGYLADQIKMDYFGVPINKVSEKMVEECFWRLLKERDDQELSVYTGKLPCHSCFPTSDSKTLIPEDKPYIDSPWNLNKFTEYGVLQNLSGCDHLKKPNCSVGMCFSSEAWRTAEQWGSTLNYMHWGEPRTWYGVSGADADRFSSCFTSESLGSLPDCGNRFPICHPSLVHTCNVTKVVQRSGEFVITLPRAYNMWFSHGYNLVETVNFYPIPWLPFGLECHKLYQSVQRRCEFSFEELLCSLFSENNEIDLVVMHYRMLKELVEEDKQSRKTARDSQCVGSEEQFFSELIPVSERCCMECDAICYLSGVRCLCSPDRMVCCLHADLLCECEPSRRVLLYRYTAEFIEETLSDMEDNIDEYIEWSVQVNGALDAVDSKQKRELSRLRALQREAMKSWTRSSLYGRLSDAVQRAVLYSREARKLLAWLRKSGDSKKADMLTFEELKLLTSQISDLQCQIPEEDQIREMLRRATLFKREMQNCIRNSILPSAQELRTLIEESERVEVHLPEKALLKQWKLGRHWLDEVSAALKNAECLTVESMRQMIERGVVLPPHPSSESVLIHLQQLKSSSTEIDDRAKQCLLSRPCQSLVQVQSVLEEANRITASLPNVSALRTAVEMATKWAASIDKLLSQAHSPFVSVLESYVAIAHTIPVHLDRLAQLDSCISAASSWYDRAAKTFLKKHSTFSLLEVLVPRTDIGMAHGYKMGKRKGKDSNSSSRMESSNVVRLLSDVSIDFMPDPTTLVVAFREDQSNELEAMSSLRALNSDKLAGRIDVSADKYCVCRHSRTASMLLCDVCKDLFHPECVSATKPAAKSSFSPDTKFLCPMCSRSRRPTLETALTLLLALQKLPVRVDCGEALQLLAERAMVWQDSVKKFLATDEMRIILARLGEMSSDHAAAYERADRIVAAEMQRAGLLHRRSAGAPLYGEQDTSGSMMMPIEHAYSSVSKHGASSGQSSSVNRGKMMTSPSSVGQWLSSHARAHLEDLMMQGDMIEVTLDETQLLWKVLRACQSGVMDSSSHRTKGPTDILSGTAEEQQHRKRRKHLEVRSEDSNIEVFVSHKKHTEKTVKGGKDRFEEKKLKPAKVSKKGKNIKQRQRQQSLDNTDDHVTAAESYDEDCAAVRCLKPLGHEVDWVQCDACEMWFHLVCVGLTKMDVSDDKDYICRTCRGHVSPQAGAGGMQSQSYDAGGRFVPRTGDLAASGRCETSNRFDVASRSQHVETVVQSTGYNYVMADGSSYQTQMVEYDNGNELRVTHPSVVGMETPDSQDQLSANHVMIAVGGQDENQVIYMYADGGPEIVSMDDLVEIETAEVVGQVVEDFETSQEIIEVDGGHTGVAVEQQSTVNHQFQRDGRVFVTHLDRVYQVQQSSGDALSVEYDASDCVGGVGTPRQP